MDRALNTIGHAAERRLAAESGLGGDLPEQLYLNHSPLAEEPRGGASRASLDDTFRELGLRSFTEDCLCTVRSRAEAAEHRPDYSRLPVNNRIFAGQGESEVHFLQPCPRRRDCAPARRGLPTRPHCRGCAQQSRSGSAYAWQCMVDDATHERRLLFGDGGSGSSG